MIPGVLNPNLSWKSQYLFVEAQSSKGLFDCRKVFPALGRGFGYSRVFPWKASTEISDVRTNTWSDGFKTAVELNTKDKSDSSS